VDREPIDNLTALDNIEINALAAVGEKLAAA